MFYASEAEKGLNGRPSIVPQGMCLAAAVRSTRWSTSAAQRQDYDTWAQMGCRNWAYEKVLPVFRDVENNQRLSGEYHGADGALEGLGPPLWTSAVLGLYPRRPRGGVSLQRRLQRRSAGRRWLLSDHDHGGRRRSAAEAFLRDAEGRANLTILTGNRVHKVLFEGKARDRRSARRWLGRS